MTFFMPMITVDIEIPNREKQKQVIKINNLGDTLYTYSDTEKIYK